MAFVRRYGADALDALRRRYATTRQWTDEEGEEMLKMCRVVAKLGR